MRSEWITLLTLSSLAICGMVLPKHSSTPAPARDAMAADGIDYMPVGSNHPVEKKKVLHPKH